LGWTHLRGTTNGIHDMRRRSEFSEAKDGEAVALSGWRVVALCGLYAFLGALAAAIAALVGTFPHWI
jgi:hypothetical protein